MNKNRSLITSLVLLLLFGVIGGCRETPISNNTIQRNQQFVGEINGIVRNGVTGAPIDGVQLRLIGVDGNVVTVTSANGGLYGFRNLQEGDYKISAVTPTGFEGTRVADVRLLRPSTTTGGLFINRVARDVRFFPNNANITGTATFVTPFGTSLPIPAGTPVIIDFTRRLTNPTGNVNDATATIGDVQTASRVDSVRAGGAIVVSGLPAVGSLADVENAPTLIIPAFTVGGVTYAIEENNRTTSRAVSFPIAGLRSGTIALPPTGLVANRATNPLPTEILATNLNGRVDFGTQDTVIIVFNKQIVPTTARFSLLRGTETIGATNDRLTQIALPAGVHVGQAVLANQAFQLRLNRPLRAGESHSVGFTVETVDGNVDFTNTSAGVSAASLSFRTVTGISLVSVTARATADTARVVTLVPGATTANAPTAGIIAFTFDRAPVGSFITRGPARNIRFLSGVATDEVGRVGVPDEVNRIDCTGTIVGNTVTFGYRNLVSTTTYTIEPSAVTISGLEQPISVDASTANTLGNFRSALAGDIGVGRVAGSVANATRSFTSSDAPQNPQTLTITTNLNDTRSFGTTDSIIVVFSRQMEPRSVRGVITRLQDINAVTGETTDATIALPADTVVTTALPAGTVLGRAVSANQAFLIRSLRPFLSGIRYRLSFGANTVAGVSFPNPRTLLRDADYTNPTGDEGLRTFTTSPGLRFLGARIVRQGATGADSLIANLTGATLTPAIPDSGTIVLEFNAPPSGIYATRGPRRNIRFLSGTATSTANEGTPELGRTGNPNEVNRIDSLGTITGNTLRFGFRGLAGTTQYQIHGAIVENINDRPIVNRTLLAGEPSGFPQATANTLGNIRSAVAGDFGVTAVQLRQVFSTSPVSDLTNEAPISVLASNLNTTSFRTDTAIVIVFNRQIQNNSTNFGTAFFISADSIRVTGASESKIRIRRNTTPYAPVLTQGTSAFEDGTARFLPAGTYLARTVAANQALRIVPNAPLTTGSEYWIEFNGLNAQTGTNTFTANTGATRTASLIATTVPGLRLLSVEGLSDTVATNGEAVFNFSVPSGATIAPIILRGANRNLELRTGATRGEGTLIGGENLPIREGDTTRFVQAQATITGSRASVSFGGLALSPSSGDQTAFHFAPTRVEVVGKTPRLRRSNTADPSVNEDAVGNVRSTLPGDFGLVSGLVTPTATLTLATTTPNLVQVFRTRRVREPLQPFQLVSFPRTNAEPTDAIVIRFNRALRVGTEADAQLAPGDLERVTGLATGRIRVFRTAEGGSLQPSPAPAGTPVQVPLSSAITTGRNDFNQAASGIPSEYVAFRATLNADSTELTIRRIPRNSTPGGDLPLAFESGTGFTVHLAIPGLANGAGGTIAGGTTNYLSFSFYTGRGLALSGTPTVTGGTSTADRSGVITLVFSQPLAPGVSLRTFGPDANLVLVTSATTLNETNVNTLADEARQGLPTAFSTALPNARVNSNGTVTGADTLRPLVADSAVISPDRLSASLSYANLNTARYTLIALRPNFTNDQAPSRFALDSTKANATTGVPFTVGGSINPNIRGVITSTVRGDYGMAGPTTNYLNQINFTFTVSPIVQPAFVTATSVSGFQTNYPTSGVPGNVQPVGGAVRLTFSKPMSALGASATIRVESSPYSFGGFASTTRTFSLNQNSADWNADSTEVTIRNNVADGSPRAFGRRPRVRPDTVEPFLAGAVYRVTVSGLVARDGGALNPFPGVVFQTLPRTTITGASIANSAGANAVSVLATTATADSLAIGDTVGTITLTFSNDIAGVYHKPGIDFRVRGRDNLSRSLAQVPATSSTTIDLTGTGLTIENTSLLGGFGFDLSGRNSDFLDSVFTVSGRNVSFRYRVSRFLETVNLGGTLGATPAAIDRNLRQSYLVQLNPTSSTAIAEYVSSTPVGGANIASTQLPSTFRSNLQGDLGVIGAAGDAGRAESRISGNSDAVHIKFFVRPGAAPRAGTSSFPDMVINAVRETTQAASTAVANTARSTVNTVKSWWKRVTE